jgi:hypothetical protein
MRRAASRAESFADKFRTGVAQPDPATRRRGHNETMSQWPFPAELLFAYGAHRGGIDIAPLRLALLGAGAAVAVAVIALARAVAVSLSLRIARQERSIR